MCNNWKEKRYINKFFYQNCQDVYNFENALINRINDICDNIIISLYQSDNTVDIDNKIYSKKGLNTLTIEDINVNTEYNKVSWIKSLKINKKDTNNYRFTKKNYNKLKSINIITPEIFELDDLSILSANNFYNNINKINHRLIIKKQDFLNKSIQEEIIDKYNNFNTYLGNDYFFLKLYSFSYKQFIGDSHLRRKFIYLNKVEDLTNTLNSIDQPDRYSRKSNNLIFLGTSNYFSYFNIKPKAWIYDLYSYKNSITMSEKQIYEILHSDNTTELENILKKYQNYLKDLLHQAIPF